VNCAAQLLTEVIRIRVSEGGGEEKRGRRRGGGEEGEEKRGRRRGGGEEGEERNERRGEGEEERRGGERRPYSDSISGQTVQIVLQYSISCNRLCLCVSV
jgi:hypothetical protein